MIITLNGIFNTPRISCLASETNISFAYGQGYEEEGIYHSFFLENEKVKN